MQELRRPEAWRPPLDTGRGEQQTADPAQALEAGINFFDTANAYSARTSEEIVGRALRDFGPRDELVIATKVHGRMHDGPNGAGLSRKAIMAEVDASLSRLGTEALHDVVKAGMATVVTPIAYPRRTASPLHTHGPHRLRPGPEVIKIAVDHGVVAAVGHTDASYDQTHAGTSAGAQTSRPLVSWAWATESPPATRRTSWCSTPP